MYYTFPQFLIPCAPTSLVLCPDNKYNKIANFSDKSFNNKSYSMLLGYSQGQYQGPILQVV